MLHRYYRSRGGDDGGAPGAGRLARRPYLATLCEDVDEAEKWRRQVLRDISRKVTEIQNRTCPSRTTCRRGRARRQPGGVTHAAAIPAWSHRGDGTDRLSFFCIRFWMVRGAMQRGLAMSERAS